MTVWIYQLDDGEYREAAVVDNGDVTDGNAALVESAFPEGIPDDEAEVARMFNGSATVASTDFEMDWDDPTPDWAEGVQASGGGPGFFRCLGGVDDRDLEAAPEWDRPLLEMYRGVSDPDADPNRALVDFAASGTPEFVLERIREAIRGGALFSQFDEIPSDRLMDLRQTFADELGTDNFTIDSITEELMEFEADLSRDEAERIARTESSAVLNKAREEGYEDRGEADERFYWSGASLGDPRQTEACAWLIRQTNPFEGGDPVPMHELRDMVAEAPEHDDDMADTLARPDSWVPHINCRSTFVKASGT